MSCRVLQILLALVEPAFAAALAFLPKLVVQRQVALPRRAAAMAAEAPREVLKLQMQFGLLDREAKAVEAPV